MVPSKSLRPRNFAFGSVAGQTLLTLRNYSLLSALISRVSTPSGELCRRNVVLEKWCRIVTPPGNSRRGTSDKVLAFLGSG